MKRPTRGHNIRAVLDNEQTGRIGIGGLTDDGLARSTLFWRNEDGGLNNRFFYLFQLRYGKQYRKSSAFAFLTHHTDLPIHQLHQFLSEGQPDAGALSRAHF